MKEPVNLTMNGRKNRISYRLVKLDKEERVIDLNKPQLLKGFNEVTKGNGYYKARFSTAASPKELIAGNYMLRSIYKAKNTDHVSIRWKVLSNILTFIMLHSISRNLSVDSWH